MSTTVRFPRDVFDLRSTFNDDAPMTVVIDDLVRDFTPAVPADARTAIYAGANRLAKAGAR